MNGKGLLHSVLKVFQMHLNWSVNVELETEYRIRVHLKYKGSSIVGDKYLLKKKY